MIRGTLLCLMALALMIAQATAEAGRDPFKFGHGPKEILPKKINKNSRLTLVLISGDSQLAIIGGDIYRPGDKIDGAIVTSITLDSVATTIHGARKVYRMERESKK